MDWTLIVLSLTLSAVCTFLGFEWVYWAAVSALSMVWALQSLLDDHYGDAIIYLIAAAGNALLALYCYRHRNDKRRKKLMELLGYKAKALRDRLVASMPQGRRSPGLGPA